MFCDRPKKPNESHEPIKPASGLFPFLSSRRETNLNDGKYGRRPWFSIGRSPREIENIKIQDPKLVGDSMVEFYWLIRDVMLRVWKKNISADA
jgi:hypothetical protein